ncbi:glycosyltransferase family 4 protein [Prosthecomicrobium sp. N25]|uniref:glycosyltransferase family 4 protein n=1 Tax=Prosthecomicrobium sp. N25 TaxID=3129254 RepID=UPI003076E221
MSHPCPASPTPRPLPGAPTETDIVVVTYFYPHQVGFGDFAQRVASLAGLGRVLLVSRQDIAELPEFRDIPFVQQVIDNPSESLAGIVRYLAAAARIVRRARPRVVVCLGTQVSMLPLLIPGTPALVYWNEHPLHIFESRAGRLKQFAKDAARRLCFAGARRARFAMPISAMMRDDLMDHGVPGDRCPVVPMGVVEAFGARPGRRAARGDAGSPIRLLYAGTVAPERGRDVMLEGLARARSRGVDVRLDLIGASSDQIDYCRTRIEELGLGGAVSVEGRIPISAVPDRIAEADGGICLWEDRPYWRFNPPTKLFEFLVAGVPVLASRIRTHTAYVRDGENGLVFDYDADHFAAAILRFAALGPQRRRLAESAARDGAAYLWIRSETAFQALVKDAMQASGRPARVPAPAS